MKCLNKAEVAVLTGKGINPSTGNIENCAQASDCELCQDNVNVCTLCYTNSTKKYLEKDNGVCYAEAGIPTGYGKVTGSNTLSKCAANNCDDCKADFNLCLACKASFTLLLNPTATPTISCVASAPTPAPTGYGLNTDNPVKYVKCSITECISCQSDYLTCQGCSNTKPYLGTISSTTSCKS